MLQIGSFLTENNFITDKTFLKYCKTEKLFFLLLIKMTNHNLTITF